jgi:hypothetical protein
MKREIEIDFDQRFEHKEHMCENATEKSQK